MKSMTAFARVSFSCLGESYSIEIQSVNRKSLEIFCYFPGLFQWFEQRARLLVGKQVTRGNVVLRINSEKNNGGSVELPSPQVLNAVYEHMCEAAAALQLSDKPSLHSVYDTALKVGPETSFGNQDEIGVILEEALIKVLDQFAQMKKSEGNALKEDLLKRVQDIKSELDQIESLTDNAPRRYHERLKTRLAEVGGIEEIDSDRLHKEVALLVERIDINEEVSRLNSHVVQFSEIVSKDQERHGRTLEFLIQEMHREANTIGAKSQELSITQGVVRIKTAIDRMREQVQNVE